MRKAVAAAAAVLAAVMGGATSAGALPYEQIHYDNHDSAVADWCGPDNPFQVDVRVTGVYSGRITGRDQTLRYTSTSHGEAVWTNLASGRAITIVWDDVSQDLRVTDAGDGTLHILFQRSGSAKIYGPDGRLQGNAPGSLRTLAIIDHGGTPLDLSDDTFISETLVSNHGKEVHEGECEAFLRLTA